LVVVYPLCRAYFSSLTLRPPGSTLFPYTTLFRSLFASEIVIHDHETGEKKEARVEVNHPAFHRGVAIYQSSFDDGGSRVKLQARSEEHTSELQSRENLVCRLLLEKKKKTKHDNRD